MMIKEVIKQLNILLSRERYLLGCSSDKHQRSQTIEALEVAKRAVEESEVKHGEWKKIQNYALCSNCKHEVNWGCKDFMSPYCPNCGARMDKE